MPMRTEKFFFNTLTVSRATDPVLPG